MKDLPDLVAAAPSRVAVELGPLGISELPPPPITVPVNEDENAGTETTA